jgi:NAD(P)H-flavin reductase
MSETVYEAVVRAKEDAGGGLFRLALELPRGLGETYVRPGQYVVLGSGAKKAYFVLAGDVGETRWELIVRAGGEVVQAVLEVPLGERVEVSAAQGGGFPIEEARGRDLLVAVTGSGIAAGRPVLRTRLREGEARSTELLLGVRTLADVPLEGELGDWSAAGARVTVCVSREPLPAGREGFAMGYVQDIARIRAAGSPPSAGKMIFAAGVKEMVSAMRALARDLGVQESDVRTNY